MSKDTPVAAHLAAFPFRERARRTGQSTRLTLFSFLSFFFSESVSLSGSFFRSSLPIVAWFEQIGDAGLFFSSTCLGLPLVDCKASLRSWHLQSLPISCILHELASFRVVNFKKLNLPVNFERPKSWRPPKTKAKTKDQMKGPGTLSPCTGSRLPGGLTRQGGKHTLQRPKGPVPTGMLCRTAFSLSLSLSLSLCIHTHTHTSREKIRYDYVFPGILGTALPCVSLFYVNDIGSTGSRDSLCIPFTLTLTLAMPSYL